MTTLLEAIVGTNLDFSDYTVILYRLRKAYSQEHGHPPVAYQTTKQTLEDLEIAWRYDYSTGGPVNRWKPERPLTLYDPPPSKDRILTFMGAPIRADLPDSAGNVIIAADA